MKSAQQNHLIGLWWREKCEKPVLMKSTGFFGKEQKVDGRRQENFCAESLRIPAEVSAGYLLRRHFCGALRAGANPLNNYTTSRVFHRIVILPADRQIASAKVYGSLLRSGAIPYAAATACRIIKAANTTTVFKAFAT